MVFIGNDFKYVFLFPIVFRLKSTFSKIISPLIAIFVYGYLSLSVGNLATIAPIKGGVVYTGLLRGIAGISLGCSCFEIAKYLREYKLTNYGKKNCNLFRNTALFFDFIFNEL